MIKSLTLPIGVALTIFATSTVATLTQTPLTPFSNLLVSANADGALAAVAVGNCGTLGPLTPGANVRVKSNTAGALNVCGTLTGGAEVAFAALPSSPVVGDTANISDSNTATWGANVAAGGSNHILARWNGSNWTVVGK